MKQVILIVGGGRSGKSNYALELAHDYKTKAFIATSEAFDDEMRERIARHRQERDSAYLTVEEPLDIARAVSSLPDRTEVAIIDCLTVWLGNLMHCHGQDQTAFDEVDSFLKLLNNPPCDLIVVTNEVGQGIIPENALARRFRDEAGILNQQVARLAQRVILMVCAIPVFIKGEQP
jgi:adenosylcobinamide kinase / adenosylcobinamide-phosphate guanylyltransferase